MGNSTTPEPTRRRFACAAPAAALIALVVGCARPGEADSEQVQVARAALRTPAIGIAPPPGDSGVASRGPKGSGTVTTVPPEKVCVGGDYDETPIVYACKSDDDCPGQCNAGPEQGKSCTTNFDCNTYCAGGTNYCSDDPALTCGPDKPCPGRCSQSGQACTSASDCGRTCAGGLNAGDACSKQADCPGECVGGRNAGQSCVSEAECAGQCEGGWQQGQVLCNSDDDCPGGCELDGTPCFGNHDLCKDVCQGGAMHGKACSENPADCLQGGGQCLPGCCHAAGACQNAGHCQLKPCTNTQTCLAGPCKNGFFWCHGRGRCVNPDQSGKVI